MSLWIGGAYSGGSGEGGSPLVSPPPPTYIGGAQFPSSGNVTSLATSPHADTLVGDLLVAQMCFDGNDAHSAPALHGWRPIDQLVNGVSIRMSTWWRIATEALDVGSPNSHVFTLAGAEEGSLVLHSIRGVDLAGSPEDALHAVSTLQAGASTAPAALGVTTAVDQCLLLWMAMSDLGQSRSFTPPAGMLERHDFGSGGSNGATQAAATEVKAAAGATGAKTGTLSSSDQWLAQLIAIAPVAA